VWITNYTTHPSLLFPRNSLLLRRWEGCMVKWWVQEYRGTYHGGTARDFLWSVRKRPREPTHMFISSDSYWREVHSGNTSYSTPMASHVYGFLPPYHNQGPRRWNTPDLSQVSLRSPTLLLTICRLIHPLKVGNMGVDNVGSDDWCPSRGRRDSS